jgi:ribonuclease HII
VHAQRRTADRRNDFRRWDPVSCVPGAIIKGLADSKLLTAKRREAVFAAIAECAVAIGLGRSEVEEVDWINVYWAAMEARRRAVEALQVTSGHVLVDGKRRIMGCRLSQTLVVGGDALCGSIAAASIVAKVTRLAFGGVRATSSWIRLRTS